jgi:hypothetical protein
LFGFPRINAKSFLIREYPFNPRSSAFYFQE